jgi:hypothetical protein
VARIHDANEHDSANQVCQRVQRIFLRFRLEGIKALVQKRATSLVPCDIRVVAWRFPSAEARLRAAPMTALVPLIHMLISGFFFNQGLLIRFSLGSLVLAV